MPKWEYFSGSLQWRGKNNWAGKINDEEVRSVDEFCNFYGQDGWELVGLTQSGVMALFVFKRQLLEHSQSARPDFDTGE